MNRYIIGALVYFACISIVSHFPHAAITAYNWSIWDKVLHFLIYLPLGVCLAIGLRDQTIAFRTATTVTLVGLVVLALGTIDEWHQSFVPGRTASIADAAADFFGGISGAVAGVFATTVFRKNRDGTHRKPVPPRFFTR